MATVLDMEKALFRWAPGDLAAGWDNVGLLVGDPDREVKKVLVALDITRDVAEEAVSGAYDLIVSHHPVMNCAWHPVQCVRSDDELGGLLMLLVRNNVSAICMHTNLDAAAGGVNDVLAGALGLEKVELLGDEGGIARMGDLTEGVSRQAFLALVKDALHPNGMRYVCGRADTIRRVAVGGGACGEMFALAAEKGCDAFVTADVKYNQFLDASAAGITLIDAGHYPTEDVICPAVAEYLAKEFPHLHIVKSNSHRELIEYYV